MGDHAHDHNWLIVNSDSGSHDPDEVDAVIAAFAHGGHPVTRIIECPAEAPPDAGTLAAADIGWLTVFAGDGTINAAVGEALGWNGKLVVLPGGTMNLLAGALYGDLPAREIAARLCAGPVQSRRLTAIRCPNRGGPPRALSGVIAGPTTEWGQIREDLRHTELGDLAGKLPGVLRDSLGGRMVRLAGADTAYPSLFVEPYPDGLHVTGFRLDGAIDLFRHGFAWLGRDFRQGPHEDLGVHRQVTIEFADGDSNGDENRSSDQLGLLVDGEPAETGSPLILESEALDLDFVALRSPGAPSGT